MFLENLGYKFPMDIFSKEIMFPRCESMNPHGVKNTSTRTGTSARLRDSNFSQRKKPTQDLQRFFRPLLSVFSGAGNDRIPSQSPRDFQDHFSRAKEQMDCRMRESKICSGAVKEKFRGEGTRGPFQQGEEDLKV